MPDKEHYLKRVVPEHRRPKFMKWLDAGLTPLDNAASVLNRIDSEFEIDRAVGLQLDTDGDIVGRKRLLDFEPSDGSSALLTDRMYRLLQKAKISINQWDGTIPGVIALWEDLFPEYQIVIEDNQDMSMNLYIIGIVSQLEKELLSRGYIAPKPEGVKINYEFNHEEDYEGTLYSGVSFSMANHYTFYSQADFDYRFEGKLYTNTVLGISHHYIMYDRLETEYQINNQLNLGGGYTIHKEYVMK